MATGTKKAAKPARSEPEPDQPNSTAASTPPTEEDIAVRAYYIYLERGGAEGNPDDDWLQAERDLSNGG